jgi:hypothetical protein
MCGVPVIGLTLGGVLGELFRNRERLVVEEGRLCCRNRLMVRGR